LCFWRLRIDLTRFLGVFGKKGVENEFSSKKQISLCGRILRFSDNMLSNFFKETRVDDAFSTPLNFLKKLKARTHGPSLANPHVGIFLISQALGLAYQTQQCLTLLFFYIIGFLYLFFQIIFIIIKF